MNKLKIFSPIKTIEDILKIKNTNCTNLYICSRQFFENNNFESINNFVKASKDNNFNLYFNFESNIKEHELPEIKEFLKFLIKQRIDGIMINSLDILGFIKDMELQFKVLIDSGLNIHNLSGIEFVNLFHKIENINITEEIYLKNIIKIRKYTKRKLSVDSDNIPWIASDVVKNKGIEAIIIKNDFQNSEDLVECINLIEQILKSPKKFKNKKFPYKSMGNNYYISNHFSGEFISPQGNNFGFAGNIKKFKWEFKRTRFKKNEINSCKLPKLTLRLVSLEQIKTLKQYIKKHSYNPVTNIEYGEIVNTADLAKYSFNENIEKVKKFCNEYNIKLQLSTPRILIERDFDRAYEYVKMLCLEKPYPSSIVVNNIGYWWALINDSELKDLNIELGQGLNLLNSASIKALLVQNKVSAIDLSNIKDIEDIKNCIKEIKDLIPSIKLNIAGSVRIPCLGLCPLNNDSAITSRLSCSAPCQNGHYAIIDPDLNKSFPISVDGFCRMHLFRDKILDLFANIQQLQEIGINEFVIDFSSLSANLVPVLLNRYLNSVIEPDNYVKDDYFYDEEYKIESAE